MVLNILKNCNCIFLNTLNNLNFMVINFKVHIQFGDCIDDNFGELVKRAWNKIYEQKGL